MKTIKLPYKSSEDLTPIFKQYSSAARYSYNRFLKNKTEKEIRYLTKSLSNIDNLNSWLIQCAIKDANAIHTKFKDEKVIFGGKENFIERLKNKISKEEYQLKRLSPINSQGEELKQGNRSFKLDIIENNQIIFKLNRNQHIELKLPNLRNNIKNELFKLQQLNEVKHQKGYTYSIRLDLEYINISFEESKNEKVRNLNENRCLGVDLNPDTIGISILENENVIYTQEFSLKPIFNKILNKKLSSNSDRMKYFQNKLKFETFEISKSIANLAKQFNCKSVFIEDLHFKQKLNKEQKHNHIRNRKNRNLWKRELFINNLNKRLNVEGIKLYSVNPAYSSFIGNLRYDYTDAVNASIEIARRGFEYRVKKNKKEFYPDLLVKHQWKEMAAKFNDWKEFFLEIKNLKLKYRVFLEDCKKSFRVFQQNSNHKSMVLNYIFYD
jgi:IS605 OrfB family transposase